jgi:MraZ protein
MDEYGMLLGTYKDLPLTPEGVLLPDHLRVEFDQGYVITRGLDGCVAVFPLPVWEVLVERIERGTSFLKSSARLFLRHFLGGASVEALGPEGLIRVPDYLRQHAALEAEVVLVGVGNRLEIWSAKRWTHEEFRMNERSLCCAEQLSELGL